MSLLSYEESEVPPLTHFGQHVDPLGRPEKSLQAVSTLLDSLSPSLDNISTSLTSLTLSIHNVSLPKHLQSNRNSRVELLNDTHATIAQRFTQLREDLRLIRQTREETLDNWRKGRDRLAANLASLSNGLETLRLEAEALSEELDTETDLLQVEGINLSTFLDSQSNFNMPPDPSNSSSTGQRGNRMDEAVEGSLGTDDVESVDGVSAEC